MRVVFLDKNKVSLKEINNFIQNKILNIFINEYNKIINRVSSILIIHINLNENILINTDKFFVFLLEKTKYFFI